MLTCGLYEFRGICLFLVASLFLYELLSNADNLQRPTVIFLSHVREFSPWLPGSRCWMPFTGIMWEAHHRFLVFRSQSVYGRTPKIQPQGLTYNDLLLSARPTYLFLIKNFIHYSLIIFCLVFKLLSEILISLHTQLSQKQNQIHKNH